MGMRNPFRVDGASAHQEDAPLWNGEEHVQKDSGTPE
jgi:hypothetical protein